MAGLASVAVVAMSPQIIAAPGNGSGSFTSTLNKGTLHSTEGGSIEGAISAYRANNSWPHKTPDYRNGRRRVGVHLPLNVAARSLRNTAAPGQTNRAGTLQYELVGHAATILEEYHEADWLALGAEVIAPDFRAVGIPLVCTVTMPTYPPPNGERLGRESTRLTHAEMTATVGLVGHCNWPENTHGDPGPLTQPYYRGGTLSAIDLILAGAGATSTPDTPKGWLMALTDEQQQEIYDKTNANNLYLKALYDDYGRKGRSMRQVILVAAERLRRLVGVTAGIDDKVDELLEPADAAPPVEG